MLAGVRKLGPIREGWMHLRARQVLVAVVALVAAVARAALVALVPLVLW